MIVRARFRELDIPIEPNNAASRAARLLALAHRIERDVENGTFRSVAEVARALGITRARASQVMRWRWATVAEQEHLLGGLAKERAVVTGLAGLVP